MKEMTCHIQTFLASKNLSENSKNAYLYDLKQLMEHCEGRLSPSTLALYQSFVQGLKSGVQKRKLSAVNQFLYYLYEQGQIDRYYKVTVPKQVVPKPVVTNLEDRDFLWTESQYEDGQLIALLIAYLGLLPSELLVMKLADVDLDFQVLTVTRSGQKRILPIPDQLLSVLALQGRKGVYLFDKKGSPYSRQWFFNRLSEFLEEQGKSEWTAQKLRKSFILSQFQSGKDMGEVAKCLGLKTTLSLEQYKNGY